MGVKYVSGTSKEVFDTSDFKVERCRFEVEVTAYQCTKTIIKTVMIDLTEETLPCIHATAYEGQDLVGIHGLVSWGKILLTREQALKLHEDLGKQLEVK